MDQGSSEQSPEEPDTGGRTDSEAGRRASESEHGLSKITHNAFENMGALGHGLKQFFQPQRRRSSVSPHDSASTCTGAPPSEPTDVGSEVGDAPASSALPLDSDNPTASVPPAALSRVLQQIRGAPPMMKRGTSLQSRRSKTGGPGDPPQKGSPQIHRRSTHEALLQAGRPRSSSTTDTPSSPALADMLLISGYHSTEEPDKVSVSVLSGDPPCRTLYRVGRKCSAKKRRNQTVISHKICLVYCTACITKYGNILSNLNLKFPFFICVSLG